MTKNTCPKRLVAHDYGKKSSSHTGILLVVQRRLCQRGLSEDAGTVHSTAKDLFAVSMYSPSPGIEHSSQGAAAADLLAWFCI